MKITQQQINKLKSYNIQPIAGLRGVSAFTPEEAAKLREFYYAENVSFEAIGAVLGVHALTVRGAIQRTHGFTRLKVKKLTAEQEQEIIAKGEADPSHKNYRALANEYGVGIWRIKNLLGLVKR